MLDYDWSTSNPVVLTKPGTFDAALQNVEAVYSGLFRQELSPGQAWEYHWVTIRGKLRNEWAMLCGYADHLVVSEAVRKATDKLRFFRAYRTRTYIVQLDLSSKEHGEMLYKREVDRLHMSNPHQVNIWNTLFEFNGGRPTNSNHLPAEDWIDLAATENIEITQRPFDQIFGNYCFKIPEYQRGYAWEEQQWEDLWGELEQLFDEDIPRLNLEDTFFGSVFFAKAGTDDDSGREVLETIDGQQRLTTLSVILKIISEELSSITQSDIKAGEL